MFVCVCVYSVNWWHSALSRAARTAHKNLHVCVSVRRLSSPSLPSPAWTDLQRPSREEVGSLGRWPRGKSQIAGMGDECGGPTLRARRSSSSYPSCTPGSSGRRIEAARPAGRNARSCCLREESARSQTRSLNGGWSESRLRFLSRRSRWCEAGRRGREAADWWTGPLRRLSPSPGRAVWLTTKKRMRKRRRSP